MANTWIYSVFSSKQLSGILYSVGNLDGAFKSWWSYAENSRCCVFIFIYLFTYLLSKFCTQGGVWTHDPKSRLL